MRCHEVDYKIVGADIQLVEIELDPGETVVAEAGAMNYMEDDIKYETKMGDGKGMLGKLMGAGKRMFAGESIFMTYFTNDGSKKRQVAFAAPYPGHIIALNMQQIDEVIFCQKGAFLAAALGTEISVAMTKKIGAGMFGKEGFILQKIAGDGMAFIHAGGTVIEKKLDNESLRVDTGCLVGFTQGIEYSVKYISSMKSMIFGGEGMFLATLQGTGTVWLQSMPFSRLVERMTPFLPVPEGK